MNAAVVIQARMSSTRFPQKMLQPLGQGTLLSQVVYRVRQAQSVQRIILATSSDESDEVLADAASQLGLEVVRGPLEDVLGRFVQAIDERIDTVVRITGDCPLIDARVIDSMLAQYGEAQVDYLCNVSPPSWPDGYDIEIVSSSALIRADRETQSAHDREHVTPYIRQHPDIFSLGNVSCPQGDYSHYHLSVDYPKDLELMDEIITHLGVDASFDDIMSLFEQEPLFAARCQQDVINAEAVATFSTDLRQRWPLPQIKQSQDLWERAAKIIPAGTQTLSKGPSQFCDGVGPKYLTKGEGCKVWDSDGNMFIDYPMALGPITLGHAHPRVNDAVQRQMEHGSSFSLMHPLEVQLAERLIDIIPCAEQVRFGKNGSDATSACIRAARAVTGRDHIARCGYHGWQDWSIDTSYGIRSRGVPQNVFDLTHPFPFNDLQALEQILQQQPCAAVILECVSVDEPQPGYLAGVKELAHKYGALLIFDEVISGFRWARGGAQEYFGVSPDLCAMGKGLANGLPLSLVAGSRTAMAAFDEIFFSFTFGGETLSLAAAMATLDVMEEADYWQHTWQQGAKLQDGFNAAAARHGLSEIARCAGMPPWTIAIFNDNDRWSSLQLKTLFQQEMLAMGILFSGSQFICLAHDDAVIEQTVAAYEQAFRVLRFAVDNHAVSALTKGRVNELIFRRS